MFGAWGWRRPRGSTVAGRAAGRHRFCPPLHSGRPRSARPPYVAQRRAKPGEKLEKPKIFRCSSHGFLFSPCSVITTRRSVSSMLARRAVPAVVLGGLGTIAVVALWAWRFPALRQVDALVQPAKG